MPPKTIEQRLEDRLNRELAALDEACDAMIYRLQYVKRKIKNGRRLNSLGEVQGMGPAIDVRCATIYAIRESIELMQ